MKKYEPQKIEKKWQEIWRKTKLYETDLAKDNSKYYNLVMFPYPSGEYLHMGHGYSYTGADVYGRFKLLSGFNLFEPIGYDSFGLPAENYAIKKGVHPEDSTKSNIEHAQSQLKSFGNAFDWSNVVTTSSPEYYKWTQWLFLKLYKEGLAYQKEAPVNWCPKCLTVLANEQVINGFCERCDSEVIQKNMSQWFFKITDYAERLIKDLDKVDWPKSSIIRQCNWIGKSEGTEIDFEIAGTEEKLKVFTTRVDTIFGATYMVIAPEHEIIKKFKDKIDNFSEVEKYIKEAEKKTDLERTELQKDKTGVELKGIKTINPFNKEEIPVYVADYIIGGYGTGAIMAVPAHDERDFEFAKKYNLPIKDVIIPYGQFEMKKDKDTEEREVVTAIVRNPKDNTYLCLDWGKFEWQSFPSGGIDGDDLETAARREVEEETGYTDLKFIKQLEVSTYADFYRPHKDSNVKAHFQYLLFELQSNKQVTVKEKEKNQHEPLWVKESEISRFLNVWNQQVAWESFTNDDFLYCDYGKLKDSGDYSGLSSEDAKEKMSKWLSDNKLGGEKVNYKLRDWSIGRQRYWGTPIPIIYCDKCGIQPVQEKDLPVELPKLDIKRVRPTGTGKGPLANVKEFVETVCPKCGGKAMRETDTMDTFVCSSFYYLRYPSVDTDIEMMDKEITKKWLPVDMYVGGAEHVTMHLLYSRFVTKALFDAGLINFDEPFLKLRHQGMILGPDGKKMSKSKGNVIIPDEVIRQYGADTFRLYLMFMGPFEDGGPWNPKGLIGTKRFLERYWELAYKIINCKTEENPQDLIYSSQEIEETVLAKLVSKTIKRVGDHIEDFKFNTAVSFMMESVNEMQKLMEKMPPEKSSNSWRDALERFSIILSPFAPHITEEIWEELGHSESIFAQSWPEIDEALAEDEIFNIVIQVNGRVRGTVEAAKGASQEEVVKLAEIVPNVKKYLASSEREREIFVKDRLINFIVK